MTSADQQPSDTDTPPQTEEWGVSVVIPAYNYAHFLGQAVDSALAQDHRPVEVIVVDDGSTDNTAEVAAQYGDRIRYIFQKNAGLPAARNTGIRNASYPFIGFLDADDLWKPEFLTRALQKFRAQPADCGLVAAQAVYMDIDGREFALKPLRWQVWGPLTVCDILLKTRFSPSAVVARKSALEAAGLFDESLRSSEDRDMWIRIAERFPVYLHEERSAIIRRHRTSMSRNAARMKANIQAVLRKSRAAGIARDAGAAFWWRAHSFMHFQTAWMYYEQGDRWTAVKELARSFLRWPCFGEPERLNEPKLFRLRSLRHFLFRTPGS